jgi:hypothetical protein
MAKFRLRLKSVQWMIAFCALAIFLGLEARGLVRLSAEYRKKAQLFAEMEALQLQIVAQHRSAENRDWAGYESEIRRNLREYIENAALQAEYCKSLKDKYSRAAARPWERVIPDPPQPHDRIHELSERDLRNPPWVRSR